MEQEPRMSIQEAASYCNVSETYIKGQMRHHGVPKHLELSPRRRFFLKSLLDEWMSSWKQVGKASK